MQKKGVTNPVTDISPAPSAPAVLLMDDEEPILESYGTILEKNGYFVLTARNGSEALGIFRAHPEIDVAILDLVVPGGMGGIQTLERMREIDPSIRAVAVSGYSDDPVLQDPGKYGFSAGIPKPFSWQELISIIEKVRKGDL